MYSNSEVRAARLAFKLSQTGSQAVVAVESGDWANYVGVYEAGGTLYLRTRLGASFTSPVTLTTGLLANAWYGLEISLDDAAGTRVSVWKEGQEGTRHEARYEMPRSLTWRFHAWASKGTLYLDGPTADGAYKEERPGGATSTTHIVGKHYEDTPSAMVRIKRYYAGGTLLATRQTFYGYPSGTELTYVQGDHLGSTSTLTNGGGNVVGRERYSAFGERRRGESYLITDQLYTGQRLNALSGLYHYSDGGSAGRFYDPLLARFVQADSVTPPGSQGLNRYTYALNRPFNLVDPTGHEPCYDGDCRGADTSSTPLEAMCGPDGCRMNPALDSTMLFYASVYGIPPELLAATQAAEAVDDQALLNRIFRDLNFGAAIMAQMDPDRYPDQVLKGLTWITAVDGLGRLRRPHPGIGVENIHIDTARGAQGHFATNYPGTSMAGLVQGGQSDAQLLVTLGTPESNILYAAAHLRQLADARTSENGSHVGGLTDNDMAIIYTAYRAGFEAFGGKDAFRAAQSPGVTLGPTFMKYLSPYKGYYR